MTDERMGVNSANVCLQMLVEKNTCGCDVAFYLLVGVSDNTCPTCWRVLVTIHVLPVAVCG